MPLWFILICNFEAEKLKNCNNSETFLRNLGGKYLFSGPTSSFRLGLQNFSVQSTLCPIYIYFMLPPLCKMSDVIWVTSLHKFAFPSTAWTHFQRVSIVPHSHSVNTLPQCEHSVNAQKTNLVQYIAGAEREHQLSIRIISVLIVHSFLNMWRVGNVFKRTSWSCFLDLYFHW